MPDPSSSAPHSLRIVHCLRAPIGGLLRNVLDLAREQARAGHLVGIIVDASTGGSFDEGRVRAMEPVLALGVTRLPMSRSVNPKDLAAALGLYRTVKAMAPDVVHGHGAKGGAFARIVGTLLSLGGPPVARLYTPHGGSLHYRMDSIAGRFYFGVERMLEYCCDGIIHVSLFEADAYLEKIGLPRCGSHIIPNGLRPEEFEIVEPDADASDLVFMGTLRELKGVDVLIRALGRLRDRRGKAPSLALIGDGPDSDRYVDLAEALGLASRITFHPPMPTRAGLAKGRLMVVPSRAESMPYIVLEAVAAGLPLVATRVGGIPEIVDGAGLVAPGSVEALAEAIARRLDDPQSAKRAASAARATLQGRFTVEAMAASVERLYRVALSQLRSDRARAPIVARPANSKALRSARSTLDHGAR